jgi:hypothetical protein
MSEGLMCLRCRKYIRCQEQPNVGQPCQCHEPIPSWDGKTQAVPHVPLQTPEQAERERESHNLGINLG